MEQPHPIIGNIHDYYTQRAHRIAQRDSQPDTLPDANTWRTQRPEVHRQFMASLGLETMPERCDLRATEMGTFSGPGYTAKKLAYQILPDCWGSAHLYRPADIPEDQKTPAVLYTCGHQAAGVVGYQFHAIAWARRGYTCLIFDTIQQHDNPGEHHGLNTGHTPEWVAMGYAASGGEVLNGMRALDLLLAQPGVDPERVGVTGISGGGAQSFMLAAADERVRAVASVAGVSSPDYAIRNGHIHHHCGCMYVHGRFAHDISYYAALIAPRALMYCFARHDGLYTPAEFRELHRRTHARFEKLGCGDKCKLYEYDGTHGYNHRNTTDTIHNWFDQHVAGETHPDVDTLAIYHNNEMLDEPTLSVFHGQTPQPNNLYHLPELLTPKAQVRLPESDAQWREIKQTAIKRLNEEVFHLLDDVQEPQSLEHYGEFTGAQYRDVYRGRLDGMEQKLVHQGPPDDSHESVIFALGERGELAMPVAGELRAQMNGVNASVIGIEPRAGGFAAFREAERFRLRREGCLLGLPPTSMLVQDLHHLWPQIKALPRVQGRRVYLYGRGEGAIAMLFHALRHADDQIAGVILENLPASFVDTEYQVFNALRVTDILQAVGLLAPMPTALVKARGTKSTLYWTQRAHDRVTDGTLFNTFNVGQALSQLDAHCAALSADTSPQLAST